MGLNAWADKLDFGPNKDKRSEKRKQLKLDWAANNAKFKAETKDTLTELAAIKADHTAKKTDLAAKKAPRAESFEGILLRPDSITYKRQGGSLAGATARVETAADARRRITATRLAMVGVFAFLVKKQAGSVYLTVEHPDYQFIVEIPVKKETKAREFATKINNAARRAA